MPKLTSYRGVVAALTITLVAVLPGGAAAQQTEPTIEPPSLDAALSVLTPAAGLLAADSGFDAAKVRLPACGVKDVLTRYHKPYQWKKTLLDTNLRVKRSYKPKELVSVSQSGIKGSGKVRKVMIKDLRAMATAAKKAGKPLAVRSAYRSYDYQKALFNNYVRTYGYAKALSFSARPGHSEHQLGTTVDLTTAPGVPLTTKFGDSPAGKWVARNGWKYGFIMMYPKGKKSASCYQYEPWHWRYFGRNLAKKIHDSGQVPRRYLYENFEIAS